jgi:hypothetical protein
VREKTAGTVFEETEVEPRSRICLRRRGEACCSGSSLSLSVRGSSLKALPRSVRIRCSNRFSGTPFCLFLEPIEFIRKDLGKYCIEACPTL